MLIGVFLVGRMIGKEVLYRKIGTAITSRHSLIYQLLSLLSESDSESLPKIEMRGMRKNEEVDTNIDVNIYASMELLFGWVVFYY